MTVGRRKALTQAEVIIQCWRELDAESVGAGELQKIGTLLFEQFGEGAAGPAAIARVLADQGVRLCHPDVLECDKVWRDRRFRELPAECLNFTTLDNAIAAVETLNRLARALMAESGEKGMAALRSRVLKIQRDLELIGHSPVGADQERTIAAEAAGWLTIWLQNPPVFEEWLALRRESPEFRQKFSQ